jgi:hypothetical protein
MQLGDGRLFQLKLRILLIGRHSGTFDYCVGVIESGAFGRAFSRRMGGCFSAAAGGDAAGVDCVDAGEGSGAGAEATG